MKAANIRNRFSSADLTLTMMEAGQGRRVKDITLDPYAENGQYKVAVTFETENPVTRPSAADRLAAVRSKLADHGLDPSRTRAGR